GASTCFLEGLDHHIVYVYFLFEHTEQASIVKLSVQLPPEWRQPFFRVMYRFNITQRRPVAAGYHPVLFFQVFIYFIDLRKVIIVDFMYFAEYSLKNFNLP